MLRRCLLLTALFTLAACGGDDLADSVTPPPPPEATPASVETPAAPAEPGPTPDGEVAPDIDAPVEETETKAVAVIEGEPHTVAESPAMPGMSDRFVFWGWSSDGLRYAFETYNPGEGAVSCDMRHDVYVVDAETDQYADGGHIAIAPTEPEPASGTCDPEDLEPVAGEQRAALFETHGIVVGNLHPPNAIVGSKVEFPNGVQSLAFRVMHGSEDVDSPTLEAGAAYYLAVKGPQSTWVIEPGRTRRPWVLGYTPKLLFVSPDGVHAAFIVQREHRAFEGTRLSWMSNGLGLPDWLL